MGGNGGEWVGMVQKSRERVGIVGTGWEWWVRFL